MSDDIKKKLVGGMVDGLFGESKKPKKPQVRWQGNDDISDMGYEPPGLGRAYDREDLEREFFNAHGRMPYGSGQGRPRSLKEVEAEREADRRAGQALRKRSKGEPTSLGVKLREHEAVITHALLEKLYGRLTNMLVTELLRSGIELRADAERRLREEVAEAIDEAVVDEARFHPTGEPVPLVVVDDFTEVDTAEAAESPTEEASETPAEDQPEE